MKLCNILENWLKDHPIYNKYCFAHHTCEDDPSACLIIIRYKDGMGVLAYIFEDAVCMWDVQSEKFIEYKPHDIKFAISLIEETVGSIVDYLKTNTTSQIPSTMHHMSLFELPF